MMEVNRLNPTKSIRIGGISHFAFVNGWLLRSWGRSCIAGNASKARFRSHRLVVAVGSPLSPFAAAVGTRRSQRRTAANLWPQWESVRGTMGRSAAAMGVRVRSYGAELCVQALSASWSVASGEERGCSLRIRRWRSVKIYRETVLQKRKKPHSWGSNSAVAFERGFVLAVRPVSCARAGHLSAMESTRPRRASGSDGIHAPAPSLWSRWNPHARAGFPTVLAEVPC